MKKILALFLGLGLLSITPVLAEDAAVKKEPAKGASTAAVPASPKDQEKQVMIGSLRAMQNQEVRVLVLQDLFNREAADLRQTQAVFCDQYKLDLEKWRKGLYRYDTKQDKFVEQTPEPAKPSN